MPRNPRALDSALDQAARLLTSELEAKREAISRELCTIPPPVPACDVNFNRLLEERASVIDELQRLRRLLAAGGEAERVRDFCQSSVYLSEATKAQAGRILDVAFTCKA